MKLRFLSLRDVVRLHEKSINRFGGTLGIRDPGGLESAVFQPQNAFHYGRGDVYDVAAAYAFHIAEGQCFLDGNKRTAVAAALVLLHQNGVKVEIDQQAFYSLLIGIAEKRVTKAELASYLRENCPRR